MRPVVSALVCTVVAAAATGSGAGAESTKDAAFRMQRAAGLDVARKLAREPPLDGFTDRKMRGIIERVCADADTGGASLGVVDEATMCLRRGRRIAESFLKFPAKLTARDADRVREMFSKNHEHPNSAIWIRVERGEVVAAETLGKHLFMHTASHYGLLAMLDRVGALSPDMTFEYIALFGDGCGWDPTLYTSGTGASTVPWFPLISYSKSKHRCPDRVVLLQQPWLQQYPTPRLYPWDKLNDTAIFRGTLSSRERLHLSALSALDVIPDAKVDFTLALQKGNKPEHIELNAEYRRRCETWLQDIIAVAGYARNATNPCVPDVATPDAPPAIFREEGKSGYQLDHKYLVSADGYAGVARFSEYFAASGIVLSFPTAWDQFYTDDVIPWVHYVPLDGATVRVADTISDTLAHLRANDVIAEDISAAASDFHAKHLTSRAHARVWQLFFALYNARWDDSHSTEHSREGTKKPQVKCNTVRDSPSFKLNKFGEFIYAQACVEPIRNLPSTQTHPRTSMRARRVPDDIDGWDFNTVFAICVTVALVVFIVQRTWHGQASTHRSCS